MSKARASELEAGRGWMALPDWIRKLMRQRWFRASPIFFIGTVITAAGTTIYQSDTVLFVGMVTMGLGVVAMWLAEMGRPRWKSLPGPLMFIAGSVVTSMSMTISPSDPLLCSGMILTGLGTVGMWLVLEATWEISAVLVAVLFAGGGAKSDGRTVGPDDHGWNDSDRYWGVRNVGVRNEPRRGGWGKDFRREGASY